MCAIGGILATDNTTLSKQLDKIKMMALFGRRRGTDSFGIYYGNRVFKQIGTFSGENKDMGDTVNNLHGVVFSAIPKTATNIVMHNRSKSVGLNELNNAHPFEYEKDGKRFIFVHNGTLKNHYELKTKYEVLTANLIGDTDSEVLGYILVHHGFDVLKEYTGAAAFCLHNITDNITYLWKGKSAWDSVTKTEERPLSVYMTSKFTAFASEAGTLVSVYNVPFAKIIDLDPNTLYEFHANELVIETPYDRSHIEYKYFTNNYTPANNHTNAYNTGKPAATKPTASAKPSTSTKVFYEIETCPQNMVGNKIYYYKGKYYQSGHPVSGKCVVDMDGVIIEKDNEIIVPKTFQFDLNKCVLMFIYDGYWLKETFYHTLVSHKSEPDVLSQLLRINNIIINADPRAVIIHSVTKSNVTERYCMSMNNMDISLPIVPLFAYSVYYIEDKSLKTMYKGVNQSITSISGKNVKIVKEEITQAETEFELYTAL